MRLAGKIEGKTQVVQVNPDPPSPEESTFDPPPQRSDVHRSIPLEIIFDLPFGFPTSNIISLHPKAESLASRTSIKRQEKGNYDF